MSLASITNHARKPREVVTLNGEPTDPRAGWVRRHQDGLWQWVRGLGAPHATAEDIVQDALMAAFAQPDWSSWSDDRCRRWLRVASRNLWRRHLRSEARRDRRTERWAQAVDDHGEEVSDDYLEALRKCQEELGPRAAKALELRYGQDAGRELMGQQLQIRPEGVKSLLQRIRATLRACIERSLASNHDSRGGN